MRKDLILRYLMTSLERLNLVHRHLILRKDRNLNTESQTNNRIEKEFQSGDLSNSDFDSILQYLDLLETEINSIREEIKES